MFSGLKTLTVAEWVTMKAAWGVNYWRRMLLYAQFDIAARSRIYPPASPHYYLHGLLAATPALPRVFLAVAVG